MNKDIKKIAIVRLSALGDIVNSVIVLQFMKQFYPHVTIDWITEEVFAPLLHEHPYIHKVHRLNLKKLKKEKSFSLLKENIKKINSFGEYDLIIDMQGLLKSAIVAKILGSNTHGFDKDSIRESIAALFYKTTSHIAYDKGVVLRNTFLVSDALKFSITPEMIAKKEPLFPITKEFTLEKGTKHIAFVIGASWPSKIYPKESLAEVARSLNAEIHIIWGNDEEKSNAQWIANETKNATVAPSLSLQELVSFISAMDLVIGNDTGPTHMAWAQNTPSITLFGPTNERMIYETPQNVALNSPSPVNIFKINREDFSIKEIQPTTIITTAKRLLHGL